MYFLQLEINSHLVCLYKYTFSAEVSSFGEMNMIFQGIRILEGLVVISKKREDNFIYTLIKNLCNALQKLEYIIL